MANNTVLQWQSHVTDSTDREVILGNLDLLEKFAKSINGGDKYTISDGQSQVTGTLSAQFNLLRTGIKNGTLKPASWKDSEPFGKITTALEVSSGKLLKRVGTAEGNITSHGKRIKDAEGNITSHTETLSGYGERISNAETTLGKKLDKTTFNSKLKELASSAELDNLRTLLNKEVSHWTEDKAPAPIKDYLPVDQIKASIQPWGQGEDPERHIGDLCTVIGEKQPDKGVSYRFVKHPDNKTFKWVKVIDNDGALALKKHSELLQKHNQLVQQYNTDKQQQDQDSEKLDQLGKNFAEEQRKSKERDKQYKVVVSTKGSIKDGVIVNGGSNNGTPVIVHTAHVYDNFGHEKTIEARNKLTWTINKGRTTKPVEKTVTGLVCEVSQDQFVNDGTNPHYYDVELNSTF